MGQQAVGRRNNAGPLAVSVTFRGRPRTFVPAPWACAILAVVLPLAVAWVLVATVYVVFHDQLLASLITRQTDMQYSYEDRIAGLRTQLDRETSRGLMDHRLLETSVHDLEARSALLEQRAVALDRLVAHTSVAAPETPVPRTVRQAASRPLPVVSRNPLLAGAKGELPSDIRAFAEPEAARPAPDPAPLRLDGLSDSQVDEPLLPAARIRPADKSAALAAPLGRDGVSTPAAVGERVGATLAGVERRQIQALAALRDPALRTVARLRTALADVGIPASAVPGFPSDVGGPFVPLPADALSFDQNAALVQEALAQADRLGVLVARVPFRKPLAGPLEVTSTFGPRLDPFYGRPAMHTGIDFRETYGDEVRATAAGTVTIAGTDGGYGTMVEVNHGNGLATRYAHLSRVDVAVNQKVAAGDIVGHVGSSGRATGPHLHYETRIDGEAVDPARFLKAGARLYD